MKTKQPPTLVGGCLVLRQPIVYRSRKRHDQSDGAAISVLDAVKIPVIASRVSWMEVVFINVGRARGRIKSSDASRRFGRVYVPRMLLFFTE